MECEPAGSWTRLKIARARGGADVSSRLAQMLNEGSGVQNSRNHSGRLIIILTGGGNEQSSS